MNYTHNSTVPFIMPKKIIIPLTSLLLFLSGCATTGSGGDTIESAILGQLSRTDQQYRSTLDAQSELDKMDKADLLISLGTKNLKNEIVTDLRRRLKEVNITGTKAATVREISMSLNDQAIDIKARFIVHLKDPDIIFKGMLNGMVAPAHEGNILYFYPAFNEIILQDVDRNNITISWSDFNDMKALVDKLKTKYNQKVANKIGNKVLKKFLTNINNKLFNRPISIPIAISPVVTKKINQLVPASPELSVNGGSGDFILSPVIKSALFHINKKRLAVMASLDAVNPGRSGVGVFEKRGPRDVSKDTFERAYQQLNNRFASMRKASFYANGETTLRGTHALIRKGFIAEQLGRALNEPNICVSYKAKEFSEQFRKKIKMATARLPNCAGLNQNCDKVYRECKNDIGGCNEQCRANYGSHQCSCSDKDGFEREKCEIMQRPACQANQLGKRRACEVREASCKAKAKNEMLACAGKQTACRSENSVRKGKCDTKRAALPAYGKQVKIAELKGVSSVHGIYGQTCINAVKFSPNLTELTLNTILTGHATINGEAYINATGTNQLACQFNFSPKVNIDAKVVQPATIKASLKATKKGTWINIKTTATTPVFTARTEPSPFIALFRDRKAELNCSLMGLSALTATSTNIAELIDAPSVTSIMSGNIKIKPQSFGIDFDLKPLKLEFTGREIILKPVWNKNSVTYQR